ncbi:MAG: TIGR00304 family membrane protein [Candidatus Bathycorpusculaceae bacterium]
MAATPETLYGLGITLILVGALIILISLALLFLKSVKGERKVKGGGAIIIGPFPIIFGTDKKAIKMVLWLALALTILLIVATVLFHLMLK